MPQPDRAGLSFFLERLLLRSPLTIDEQVDILGMRSHASSVRAKRDLLLVGETTDSVRIVVSGLIGRFDQLREGKRQISALYIPGDACDLHSVVAPVSSTGLTALTAAMVLHVPHEDLRDVTAKHPNIAMALMRDMAVDASVSAKWVANVGRKDALGRVTHLLCEIGTRFELAKFSSREEFTFHMSQEQVADATGLTTVHVNRMLQILRRDNIISMQSNEVRILDWLRLASIAEFDTTFLLIMNETPLSPT